MNNPKRRPISSGIPCPVDPNHGPLTDIDGRLYCRNQAHDGRPKTHPAGPAPRTSPFPDNAPAVEVEIPKRRTVVDYSRPAPAGFTFQHVAPTTKPQEDREAPTEALTLWT